MNKKIKDAYEEINMTKEVENRIIEKSIASRSIFRRKKFALVIGAICLFLLIGTTVSAEDVESFFAMIFDRGAVTDVDGNRYQMYEEVNGVHYNDLSHITSDDYMVTTLDKIEKLIGVKVLKYDDATSNEYGCDFIANSEINSKHKGRVERVYMYNSDFYTGEYGWNESIGTNNGFNLLIRTISDEAEESTKLSYLEEMNVMKDKHIIEEYHSDNLNTKILLYNYVCEYDVCQNKDYSELHAMFVYKNIRYEISGYFNDEVPIDKLKDIIENMHE